MKNALHLIIATLTILFVACKKESTVKYTGISASKSGTEWKAAAVNSSTRYAPVNKKDTLVIRGNYGEENLIIVLPQKGKATYASGEIKAYYYKTIGFDVLEYHYNLATSAANSIVITDYDEAKHVLKASFNLEFKRSNEHYSPETLKFTNGVINVELSDKSAPAPRGYPFIF